MGWEMFPHIALFPGGSGPQPIACIVGPTRGTRVHIPNRTSIGSAMLAQLTVVSIRQIHADTDHATPVAIGRIYALCACYAA